MLLTQKASEAETEIQRIKISAIKVNHNKARSQLRQVTIKLGHSKGGINVDVGHNLIRKGISRYVKYIRGLNNLDTTFYA